MKRYLVLILCTISLAGYSQRNRFTDTIKIGSSTLNVMVHLPAGYNQASPTKYPLVLFRHGFGETGSTLADTIDFHVWGPFAESSGTPRWDQTFSFTVDGETVTPIVAAVQVSYAYNNGSVESIAPTLMDNILNRFVAKWNIDTANINATGYSAGWWACMGYASYSMTYAHRIHGMAGVAAPTPGSGGTVTAFHMRTSNIRDAGIRYYGAVGTEDPYEAFNQSVYDTLAGLAGSFAYYDAVSGAGHTGTFVHNFFNPTYTHPTIGTDIYTFLLSSEPLEGEDPDPNCDANAGPDQTVTRDSGQTLLDGTGSIGSNLTYSWELLTSRSFDWVSQMKGRNKAQCDVYVLPYVAGTPYFDYKLTVSDGLGCTSSDTVRVNIDYGTPPPQSTDGFNGWHYANSTDVSNINVTNPGLCRLNDIIINGANALTGPSGNEISINLAGHTGININPGTRILIAAGSYREIWLDFPEDECVGSAENPVIITNYGGQVECNWILLSNAVHTKLTGRYVEGVSGHPSYLGHANGAYAWSRGKYGIFCNNKWQSRASAGIRPYGPGTDGLEIEFLEVGNGNFAGIMAKEDNAEDPWEDCYFHDIYFHDIGGEGMYLGSTGVDPEHLCVNWRVENIRSINAGNEGIQFNNIGYGSRVQNNVVIGPAAGWLSNFSNFQDFADQFAARAGNTHFRNNITLGGTCFTNFFYGSKTGTTDGNDTMYVCNNLFKYVRGQLDAYITDGTGAHSAQRMKIDSNYWGGAVFTADLIYTDSRGSNLTVALRLDGSPPNYLVRGNIHDNSKTTFTQNWTTGVSTAENNNVGSVPNPQFVNSGWPVDHDYASISVWCDSIYRVWGDEPSTQSGVDVDKPIVYQTGDNVTFMSKYYRSLVDNNHGHVPRGHTDEYWELMTWTDSQGNVYNYPPEDYRLVNGSFYQQKNIGLLDVGNIKYKIKFKRHGKINFNPPD